MTVLCYTAHGLRIESAVALPLPPAPPGAGRTDVRIRPGEVPVALEAAEVVAPVIQARTDAFLLTLPGVGRFLAAGGREVRVRPEDGAPEGTLGLHLSHAVLIALLYQRGRLPLHGCGVLVDGDCVVFLAHSGYGKSVLAAALRQRGYPVLDDDICAVSMDDAGIRVYPGSRRMHLWPDAVEALGLDEARGLQLHPGIRRAAFADDTPIPDGPYPLARIYVMTETRIEPEGFVRLQGSEAVMALSVLTHCRPYGSLIPVQRRQFAAHAAIVRAVPIFRWRLRWGWDRYQAALDRLEEHLARVAGNAPLNTNVREKTP